MAQPNSPQCLLLDSKIKDLVIQYEDMISGRKARVLVDQNGERIEYNAGNVTRLATYIAQVKSEYDKNCGSGAKAMSRPIRPFF